MVNSPKIIREIMKDMSKLGGMVLLCLTLLFIIYQLVFPQITKTEQLYFTQQLEKVLDKVNYTNDLLSSKTQVNGLISYQTCNNKQVLQRIAELQTNQGYNGQIVFLVALSNTSISQLEVVFHRETPGLGDVIERDKSDWLMQFAKSLDAIKADKKQLQLKKWGGDIDGLAGATITASAISNRLQYFIDNELDTLLQINHCEQIANANK